ncbi:MAG: DUF2442 domain-containing protein [Flavobacteriales bacterium]|nr:DUF2442 domain-containing protein [Flavobacteriales bacterium]
MKLPKLFSVTDAKSLSDYRLLIAFSDGAVREVDFGPYLHQRDRGYYVRYRQKKEFMKFKLVDGNIVWGKNWELIFNLDELYTGNIGK